MSIAMSTESKKSVKSSCHTGRPVPDSIDKDKKIHVHNPIHSFCHQEKANIKKHH